MSTVHADLPRNELLRRVGDIAQIAGVTPHLLTGGAGDGVAAVSVRSGGGLSFTVLPGRGMDVGLADYRGTPLCWWSPTGIVAANRYEPAGSGWLRGYFGGLLVTCGLTSAGQPSHDAGEELGLHGRASNLPAYAVCADAEWVGDQYRLSVRGKVREAVALGSAVELTRTVQTTLGASHLVVTDSVENLGPDPAPHMIKYHLNFGYPFIWSDTELLGELELMAGRDEESERHAADWSRFTEPINGAREQVHYLHAEPAADGTATVALVNPRTSPDTAGLYLTYTTETLPELVLWKHLAAGRYVVALEPSNCRDGGRAVERSAGRLVELQPGERRSYRLEIGVLDAEAAARMRRSGQVASATTERGKNHHE